MTDAVTPTDAQKYQKWAPDLEAIPEDEEALIDKMVNDLRGNNELQYDKSKKNKKLWRNGKPHAIRDAHAKSCAILHGELTVRPDIPPTYRQGMFAEPGKTYPVIARISTTSGAIRSDQVRGVRGLGLKVLGACSPTDERASVVFAKDLNQDFVFVTEPAFPFSDAKDYASRGMRTAKTLARLPDGVIIGLNTALRGVRRVVKLAGGDLSGTLRAFADPNYHVLGQAFYTAAPLRFGQYVAKLSVTPAANTATAGLKGTTISRHGSEALTVAVKDFFGSKDAEYVVSAQLCTNPTDMPIEDAKIEWSEADSPYEPVATIRYPRQTAHSEKLETFGDDLLTFNSWRGLDAHRPMGGINRLKLRVYEESSKFRHSRNDAEFLEPTDLSKMPG